MPPLRKYLKRKVPNIIAITLIRLKANKSLNDESIDTLYSATACKEYTYTKKYSCHSYDAT